MTVCISRRLTALLFAALLVMSHANDQLCYREEMITSLHAVLPIAVFIPIFIFLIEFVSWLGLKDREDAPNCKLAANVHRRGECALVVFMILTGGAFGYFGHRTVRNIEEGELYACVFSENHTIQANEHYCRSNITIKQFEPWISSLTSTYLAVSGMTVCMVFYYWNTCIRDVFPSFTANAMVGIIAFLATLQGLAGLYFLLNTSFGYSNDSHSSATLARTCNDVTTRGTLSCVNDSYKGAGTCQWQRAIGEAP